MNTGKMGGRELVARKVRRHFEELAVHIHKRAIDGLWTDEGFQPGPEDPFTLDTSERRLRFRQYLDAVDWTDAGQVRRALRVFWSQSRYVEDYDGEGIDLLRRQGYSFDDEGNPSGGPFVTGLREELLSGVKDPQVLLDHIVRIEKAATEEDPTLVIGSAKELVESTAKIVLAARGIEIEPGKDDLPGLIKKSMVALGVHPSVIASGADGEPGSRKVLSGLSMVVNGLNELRNVGYGTGHGRAETKGGLNTRHAHLAATSARAWCEFMLATLMDPAAPWRKTGSE